MPRTGLPFAAGSETSYEAAIRAQQFVSAQGLLVWRWLSARGALGGTMKEAAAALGIGRPSLCARFRGLEHAGAIRKLAVKRAGCVAYSVTHRAPPQQLGMF